MLLTLGAHTGALLLVLVLPMVAWQQVGLAVGIGLSLWWQIRHGIGATTFEMRLAEDGSCVRTTQGQAQSYRIVQANTHPGFIRLILRRPGERTCIQLLARDSLEPEIYRNLRAMIAQRRLPVIDPGLTPRN